MQDLLVFVVLIQIRITKNEQLCFILGNAHHERRLIKKATKPNYVHGPNLNSSRIYVESHEAKEGLPNSDILKATTFRRYRRCE